MRVWNEREGEKRSLLRGGASGRGRVNERTGRKRGRRETERRNVDSIHRAQVEMVIHKYSYGIPEARKTFISAEAHVCSPPPPSPSFPPRVYSVILRPANGKAPSSGGEKCWNYDFSAGDPSRGDRAPHENTNFPDANF